MNLFELNQTFKELSERDDLDTETLNDTLDSIEEDRNVKLDNIANWIERNKSEIDFLRKKIKDLQITQKALENKNKSLMKYLTEAIDDTGLKKVTTDNHIFSTRNYRKPLVIDPINLDKDYYKVVESTEVDKERIRKDLEEGKTIKGAYLAENRKTVIK